MTTLDFLSVGEHGTVAGVRADGELAMRLLDMGVVQGVEVSVERKAPLGDPIVISLLDYRLSLRSCEARSIEIQ